MHYNFLRFLFPWKLADTHLFPFSFYMRWQSSITILIIAFTPADTYFRQSSYFSWFYCFYCYYHFSLNNLFYRSLHHISFCHVILIILFICNLFHMILFLLLFLVFIFSLVFLQSIYAQLFMSLFLLLYCFLYLLITPPLVTMISSAFFSFPIPHHKMLKFHF